MVLWKTVVDQNLDFIGIFEDDIYLGEQAAKVLSRTEWIPEDGHIIKVEAFYPKVTTSIKLKQIKCINRKLMPLKSKHMGTGGYILSNQGAKALLAFIQSYKKLIPIDHIMFKDYLRQGKYDVYQMSPAVCIQDFILMRDKTNFPSYLSQDRKLRKGNNIRVNHKLMFKDKITREFVRLSAQLIRFVKAESIVKIKFK
ncbi:Lipooligosaccharide biosynthesis protein lex-1 [Acinetobacter venetianus]|nr:Lipooligosaccharide biosynthesis protein lex-1 [Acinetobacter venetianus]